MYHVALTPSSYKLADNQYSLVLSSWEELCHRIVQLSPCTRIDNISKLSHEILKTSTLVDRFTELSLNWCHMVTSDANALTIYKSVARYQESCKPTTGAESKIQLQ